MPALTGEVIMTLTDPLGDPAFTVYIFFDPTTRAFRSATQATSRGNRTGAIVVDNQTGKAQKLAVGNQVMNIATNGDVVSVAQLSAFGYNVIEDVSGISPVIV
jgi:hypothetical protein